MPFYWRFPGWLASTSGRVDVAGSGTSGEAELVLLVDGDEILVTVGSDHTDRRAEAIDIGLSKAICPKPVGRTAWRAEDIGDRWGELVLRSWITEGGVEVAYQEGPCSSLVALWTCWRASPSAAPGASRCSRGRCRRSAAFARPRDSEPSSPTRRGAAPSA